MAQFEPGVTAYGALVLWVGCLIVGLTGLVWPHQLPLPPKRELPPIVATMLNATISNAPTSPTEDPASQIPPTPPAQEPAPQPAVHTPGDAPPLQAIAQPSPKIAFALPTQSAGPTVSAAAAVPSRAATTAEPGTTPGPTVEHLVYGQGSGEQPAPEYPREAALAGQQGTVIVQFTVDRDGRVSSAFIKTPSRSALLNQAALRTIRDSWRFKPGAPMTYDISIIFNLSHP